MVFSPDVPALPETQGVELFSTSPQKQCKEVVRDFPKAHIPSVPYFNLLLERHVSQYP